MTGRAPPRSVRPCPGHPHPAPPAPGPPARGRPRAALGADRSAQRSGRSSGEGASGAPPPGRARLRRPEQQQLSTTPSRPQSSRTQRVRPSNRPAPRSAASNAVMRRADSVERFRDLLEGSLRCLAEERGVMCRLRGSSPAQAIGPTCPHHGEGVLQVIEDIGGGCTAANRRIAPACQPCGSGTAPRGRQGSFAGADAGASPIPGHAAGGRSWAHGSSGRTGR